MAVWSIGLTPMSPVIRVVPVVDIPDFANIAKSPALPRFTGSGPSIAAGDAVAVVTLASMVTEAKTMRIAAQITADFVTFFMDYPFLSL
jgi:hypothetical protein